jgi:menaquinone-dependent protoporphyrinogen oxidase
MKVLVAYASRHGATKEIAERITTALREGGFATDLLPASSVDDIEMYDAFVIGSAAYTGQWLREAAEFVRRHGRALAERPVWLFSSGPIGGFQMPEPKDLAEFRGVIRPRGDRVFGGKLDPAHLSFVERMMAKVVRVSGDFRDWAKIDAWAREIAEALGAEGTREPAGVRRS